MNSISSDLHFIPNLFVTEIFRVISYHSFFFLTIQFVVALHVLDKSNRNT